MKQLYIIIFLGFFTYSAYAQNAADKSSIYVYQESLEQKEDFWSKLKSVFKPKKKKKQVVRTSDPVLVKNDPNRTVKRVPRHRYKKIEEVQQEPVKKQTTLVKQKPAVKHQPLARNNPYAKEKAVVSEKSVEMPAQNIEGMSTAVKMKKSFGQFWNELLNGKGYVPQRKYNSHKTSLPKETTRVDNTNVTESDKKSTQRSVVLQNKRQALENSRYNAEQNRRNKSNAIARVAEPKPAEKRVEVKTEIADNTIRNEIKPLSLTNSTNGTASYFFTGVETGKFYVVTNLAAKGSVVKVTNPQNGKSLLAEVMDYLPSADTKRGLLLKISDNAKMPLGQKNNSFTVKVNY